MSDRKRVGDRVGLLLAGEADREQAIREQFTSRPAGGPDAGELADSEPDPVPVPGPDPELEPEPNETVESGTEQDERAHAADDGAAGVPVDPPRAADGGPADPAAAGSSPDHPDDAGAPERPPAPIARVSDDPADWRELDHALARNAEDPSKWSRMTFPTSAWLADGVAKSLKRRKRALREGRGEGLTFAGTDRHLRKVLSLQLLTALPLDDVGEVEQLLRRGYREGWFEPKHRTVYLEVTPGMRDALEATLDALHERGLTRAALRHLQILAVVYGIDPDEPVIEGGDAQSRLDALLA